MKFAPKSLLAYGAAISLLAYFGGIYSGNPQLTEAAKPLLLLFLGIWLIYVFFGLVNLGKGTFGR